MNFITPAFLFFLTAACLVYYIIPKSARIGWLLVCNYIFYLYNPENAGFVALLLAATLITFASGILLERLKKPIFRKLCVALSLFACIGSLVFYKYLGFLGRGLAGLLSVVGISYHAPSFNLVIPLGISYFTFAALGYVIDVYRGKPAQKNILYYAVFVSLFPCIVTGPIERAEHIIPQLKRPHTFSYNRFCGGMFRILWGFFKKLVIADTIGGVVSAVYSSVRYESYTGPILLGASLLFSYQLYCDFSACSDIAVGAGALFGLEITENFRRPFAAHSFIDLWRRWHISLTNWFRDYLYIPLGGNRKGVVRQYLNQIIVFLVSGLWHGASLPFLLWGALNGIYLGIGKATAPIRKKLQKHNPFYYFAPVRKILQSTITYLLFTSCMVLFLVGTYSGGNLSDAGYVYQHLFTGWGELSASIATFISLGFDGTTTLVVAFGIALVEGLEQFYIPMQKLARRIPLPLRWALYYVLLLGILFFGAFGQSSFIYQAY